MHISGLVTVPESDEALVKRAVEIIGASFSEEQWFVTWADCLNALGATDERKRAVILAAVEDSLRAHLPYEGVYVLEDLSAAIGCYRASELGGLTHPEVEESRSACVDAITTPEERELLEKRARAMAPVSDFGWAPEAARGRDHIYAYALAVDPEARGTGALRRLFEALFAYADAEGLDIYLECYTERLENLYAHFGFELIDVLTCDAVRVAERRMVRRCRK